MKTKTEKGAPIYEVVREENAFAIHRNGRYLMTPAGNAVRVPTEKLAQSVAAEWLAQGEKVVPATMPLTQLTATSLDITTKNRDKIIGGLLAYIASELLCHQVETPSSLAAKQASLWQPYLDWCMKRYDVAFTTGSGIMPIAQNPEVTTRLHKVIESYNAFRLAGLSSAVDSAGSLVLGLALAEGFASAPSIFEAAELDFAHQAITWGEDPVTKARQAQIRADLEACAAWFGLL